ARIAGGSAEPAIRYSPLCWSEVLALKARTCHASVSRQAKPAADAVANVRQYCPLLSRNVRPIGTVACSDGSPTCSVSADDRAPRATMPSAVVANKSDGVGCRTERPARIPMTRLAAIADHSGHDQRCRGIAPRCLAARAASRSVTVAGFDPSGDA